MPKRKAVEIEQEKPPSAEASKPKSKKQLRQEAMERARQWGAEDKARLRQLSPAASSKKGTTTASPSDLTSPTKRRKVEKEEVKIISIKDKKQQALQRVKEFAERDKAELEKKKQEAEKSKTKAGPGKTVNEAPKTEIETPDSRYPFPHGFNPANVNSAPPANAAAMNPAYMTQFMMQRQMMNNMTGMYNYGYPYGYYNPPLSNPAMAGMYGPMMTPSQSHAGQPPHHQQPEINNKPIAPPAPAVPTTPIEAPSGSGAPVPAKSKGPPSKVLPPKPNVVPQPSTQGTKATAIPDSDDDDDMVPPPPMTKLEKQISERVMANCAASYYNQPLPYQEPPPEADSYQPDGDEEEEEIDEEPIFVDHEETVQLPSVAATKHLFSRNLIVAVAVGLISCLIMIQGGVWNFLKFETSDSNERAAAINPPCFIDSGFVEVHSCEADLGVPCPFGGVCEHGRLVNCVNSYYQVAQSQDSCVLSKKTNATLAVLKQLLHEWTARDYCGLPSKSTKMVASKGSHPFFSYSQLQLERPMELATNVLDQEILQLGGFVVVRRDDGMYLGLAGDETLSLSASCRIGLFLKGVLNTFGSITIILAHSVFGLTWSSVRSYPWVTLLGLIVVVLVKLNRDAQAKRQKILKDVATVRQWTYRRLQDDPSSTPHIVLHIRDEMAMELFPDSKKQRQYIITKVWPRVVPDILQDNRIRKTTKLVDGNLRDVWQWVAAPSSSTKKKTTTFE